MSSIAQIPPSLSTRKLIVASVGIHALLLIAPLKQRLAPNFSIQVPSSLSVVLQADQVRLPAPKEMVRPLPTTTTPALKPTKKPLEGLSMPAPAQAPLNQNTSAQNRDVSASDFKKYADPLYPRIALRQGLEGQVLLAMWAEDGLKVSKVEIVESSGYPVLDEAARTAALEWVLGRPIPATTRLTKRVIFRIEN